MSHLAIALPGLSVGGGLVVDPKASEHTCEFPHYALRVRYRLEQSVERHLQALGYRPFVARCKRRSRWSDRVAEIEAPLFPGYVFCSFDIRKRLPVISTPGVLSIIGAGKEPLPVEPSELDALRTIMAQGSEVEACVLTPGQRVRVEKGPLRGVEGVLVRVSGKHRLVISISLLERSVSAEIEGDEAVPVR